MVPFTTLTASGSSVSLTAGPLALVPWRDPHSVSPEQLLATIETLKEACLANPGSADLRTCLGVAHAMNHDVDRSMDALEEAVALAPESFWPQVKYAELHYRLRALNKSEAYTLKALDLAVNAWQVSIARKQLQEIRALKRASVRNVEWTKPLTVPVLVLSAMLVAVFAIMWWA
jgi:cytochrome c-type biogenesis protein CcmH/NrfG